ncbi:hypothetical protein MVEN_01593900 [Mycena venus]|uniref:Uncharacterized protein n=1 Tax=Mycena venus TaxID=2733690 RepID=A0A8H6XRC1_9AGAR|nr:hypothetical protein MVEN_01593900 [Mycena venus]
MAHTTSDTSGEMSPTILKQIGKFTETLHKIHTFIEAQQDGNKIKKLFRQGEMSRLLKDCRTGLQQGLNFFKIESVNLLTNVETLQQEAEHRHQQVLDMIEILSDAAGSDKASSVFILFSMSMPNLVITFGTDKPGVCRVIQ